MRSIQKTKSVAEAFQLRSFWTLLHNYMSLISQTAQIKKVSPIYRRSYFLHCTRHTVGRSSPRLSFTTKVSMSTVIYKKGEVCLLILYNGKAYLSCAYRVIEKECCVTETLDVLVGYLIVLTYKQLHISYA